MTNFSGSASGNISPDLDRNNDGVRHFDAISELTFFTARLIFKKKSTTKKHAQFPSMLRFNLAITSTVY